MPKPTTEQICAAITAHIAAVGSANASAIEVCLHLDLEHPGMTDAEFKELQQQVAPLVSEARRKGCSAIWS